MEYKKVQGEKYRTGFVTGVKTKWSAVAVKRILTNESYIGTLVQGKEERINYKVKKSVKKPEEEWIKVEQTHEAIISPEDYKIVQELLKTDTRAGSGEKKAHIYAGLLYCGDCGEPMVRRVSRYKGKEKLSFICSARNKNGKCRRHTISEEDLNGVVLAGLKTQVSLFIDKSKVLQGISQMEVNFEEVASFDAEIKRLRMEQDKYIMLRSSLYEDLKKQVITEEDFKNFREIYEQRYQEIERAIHNQEETIKKLFKSGIAAGVNLERMKSLMQITELDRMTLVLFVKRILVYDDKKVYIELRHKELFSKVTILADYLETKQSVGKEAV